MALEFVSLHPWTQYKHVTFEPWENQNNLKILNIVLLRKLQNNFKAMKHELNHDMDIHENVFNQFNKISGLSFTRRRMNQSQMNFKNK